MNLNELIKVAVASLLLSNILYALGASNWVVYGCSIGMGLFWIYPKEKAQG